MTNAALNAVVIILIVVGLGLLLAGGYVAVRRPGASITTPPGNVGASMQVPLAVALIILGGVSLFAAGFLALNAPVKPPVAQPAPGESTTRSTSTADNGVVPTSEAAPPNVPPTSDSPTQLQAVAVARIADPRPNARVGTCKRVVGTSSNLPAGTTLVTVKHKPGGDWYMELPSGWQTPAELASWEDTQYFEQADGERFTVYVFLAPLSEVTAAKDNPKFEKTWFQRTIPSTWKQLDAVTVEVDSTVTADC